MDLVGDNIEALKPYQPGKPVEELERELGIKNALKLASNENPLGPSPHAVEAIREAASGVHVYPDAGTFRLREALAEKHGCEMDEIVVGNGSNEILTLLARTFGPGGNAVIADYSFIAYRLVLQAANVPTTIVPTGEDFTQDLSAMAAACDDDTRLVYLANPNNPTGVYTAEDELEAFLRDVPDHVIVVIDEAYVEYALADDYVSAMQLRDVRERLVVCRTFSKCYGLAGLRVGYAVTRPELVDYLNRVREPFNSNLLAQSAALAALGDVEHIERSVKNNEQCRGLLQQGLESAELRWIPSQTNFLLVETARGGIETYEAMLRNGVIVRPLAGYGLHDYVRVTIGTPDETLRVAMSLSMHAGARS